MCKVPVVRPKRVWVVSCLATLSIFAILCDGVMTVAMSHEDTAKNDVQTPLRDVPNDVPNSQGGAAFRSRNKIPKNVFFMSQNRGLSDGGETDEPSPTGGSSTSTQITTETTTTTKTTTKTTTSTTTTSTTVTTTTTTQPCQQIPQPCEVRMGDSGTPNPYTGVCENDPAAPEMFKCECSSGFEQEGADPTTCIDINECEDEPSVCDSDTSTCRNTIGDYQCDCHKGFEPKPGTEGHECQDANECEQEPQNPCEKQKEENDAEGVVPNPYTGNCDNIWGSYICECTSGFGNEEAGYICEDVDECAGASLNDCEEETSKCENTIGSYKCNCNWGYKHPTAAPADNKICEDIDECSEGVDGDLGVVACDSRTGLCENYVGRYACNCYEGYRVADAPDFENGCGDCCVDINECASDSINECGDDCEFGTFDDGAPWGVNYTCSCFDGRFPRDELVCENCQWGDWGQWGDCNVTCGNGYRIREREPKDGFGSGEEECEESDMTMELQPCVERPCPESNCQISSWSVWGDCSAECGGGKQTRTRTILEETNPGDCDGEELSETQDCNTESCDVEVNWVPMAIAGAGVGGVVLVGGLFIRHRRGSRRDDYM